MRSRDANAINARLAKPGPILAPAASLAGDAQTLSTALGAHDNATASGAMASILSDRDKIEAAAKIAGGQYPEQWTEYQGEDRGARKTGADGEGSYRAQRDAGVARVGRAAGGRKDAGCAEDPDRFAGVPGRQGCA